MAQELLYEVRESRGTAKANKLRAEGKLPAIVYGEGQPATAISINARIFNKLLHDGERVVILKDHGGEEVQALIKDIQYDAFGERLLHVDFNKLRAGQTVTVRVSITLTGSPKGAINGGIINHALHELEVECLPLAIPEKIVADVSGLELGQSIHISDLKLPEGVKSAADSNLVVAVCEEPRKAKEEVVLAEGEEGEAKEPEVLTEKKEDKDEKKEDKKDKK